MSSTRAFALTILLGCAAALAACSDDPINAATNLDAGNDAGNGDAGNGDAGVTGRARLVLLTEEEPTVSYSERVAIRVQYLNRNNNPVSGTLSFETSGSLEGTSLSATNAQTDANGIASVDIIAGDELADFDVTISVNGNDSVNPVSVRVRVQPKDTSDYLVRVNYDGPVELNEVEVTLFEADTDCDELERLAEGNPSSDTASMTLELRPAADGSVPDRTFDAPRSLEFTYAVARGEGQDENGNGVGYFATFGCTDGLEVPDGGTAIVEIDLENLWPAVAGTYRIQTEMNMLNAIPDDAEDIVNTIVAIFESPGLGVLQLVAVASYALTGPEFDEDTGRELEYWEVSPWSFLLDQDDDGQVVPSTIGMAVAGVLDSLIEDGLEATGAFGSTITAIVNAINALLDNAQNFTLHGDLVLVGEPDETGFIGEENEVRYNQITIVWQGTDYSIQLRSGSIIDATDVIASVGFHPANDDAVYALHLSPFDIQLNYGDVLLWIVESVVFPTLLGDDINSFEDFFDNIVDCEELADRLDCTGEFDTGGDREEDCIEQTRTLGLGDTAAFACSSFRDVASTTLRNWVDDQTAGLGNYFRMGTFEDDPCAMGFSTTANEFEVTTMGAEDDRCEWDARVRFTDLPTDPGEPMDGDWFGERL